MSEVSTPGWYPDPGGDPERYRFFDGQTWSEATSPDPRADPPGPRAPTPPSTRPRPRPGLLIAALVLVVVAAVTVSVVIVGPGNRVGASQPTPMSTPVRAGGSNQTPDASPAQAPCPRGDPLARLRYPRDGRLHGGGLSLPARQGWASPGVQLAGFTWAHDVGETDVFVQPNWLMGYAIGSVSVADGFGSPRAAAELSMSCTASAPSFYRSVISRRDLSSQADRIGGRPAWTLRAEIKVTEHPMPYTGDVVSITVVDLGIPDSLGFFWGCAPIGDRRLLRQLDRAAAALQVD